MNAIALNSSMFNGARIMVLPSRAFWSQKSAKAGVFSQTAPATSR